MGGFFKSLFSSENVIETGIKALVDSGDALVYTAEEKAESRAAGRVWYLDLMKAISPSAKSRRGVAWAITGMVMLLTVVAVVCKLGGWQENAEFILKLMTDVWSWPFVAVVGFYFAPGLMPSKNK
jgi:hypothetical protein